MKPIVMALAAFVISSCCGCATATLTSGKRFDSSKAAQIQDGRTTKEELLEWFGEPFSKTANGAESEAWLYFFNRSKSEVQSYLITVAVKTEGTTKKLEIQLKNGVVENHSFVEGPVGPSKK